MQLGCVHYSATPLLRSSARPLARHFTLQLRHRRTCREIGLPAGPFRLACHLFTYAHVTRSLLSRTYITGHDPPREQPPLSPLLRHCVWCTHLRRPHVRPSLLSISTSQNSPSTSSRPQFIEIYKRRQVIGISMTFLAIDISGGVFSLLSLVFNDTFDGIAALTYLGVVVSTAPCLTHVPVTIIQSLQSLPYSTD